MKLKGSTGVDLEALVAKSKELTRAYQDGKIKVDSKPRDDGWLVDAPPQKGRQAVSVEMLLLQSVLDDPKSGIDKTKLPNLRKATATEVEEAIHSFNALKWLDADLSKVLEAVQFVSILAAKDQVQPGEVDLGARLAQDALVKIEWVKRALQAVGPCAAAANFPSAALGALEANLKVDLGVLESERPKPKLEPLARSGAVSTGWATQRDPSPTQLPKAVQLTSHQLGTPDDLARAISSRLKQPELGAAILEAIQVHGGAEGPLAKRLVSFALLVDEAVTAPDYQRGFGGGMDRSVYRARQHAHPGSLDRQRTSRGELTKALTESLGAKDPVAAIEGALVTQFQREVGLKPQEIVGWRSHPDAIAAALEAEAFLPIRAFVERAASDTYYLPKPVTHAVVLDAVQAITEGRYAEWRLTNAGSREQLSVLKEGQLEAFKQRLSTSFELPTNQDGKVQLKTRELGGEDLQLLWATKCGGPSHGFDLSVTCALSLLVNGRNTIIVVDDPRWPHPAARTYLRLVSRPKTEEPVLFVEGPALDFPYPRHLMLELEKAIIRHAIEKAKSMKLPLAISGSVSRAVTELKLPVKTHAPCAEPYRLGPSLLLEAASVFGSHDWPQQKAEVRPVVKHHYVLEDPAAAE